VQLSTANAKILYLLAQEFGIFELSSYCAQLISDLQLLTRRLRPLVLDSIEIA
jgi:hypothetical protein